MKSLLKKTLAALEEEYQNGLEAGVLPSDVTESVIADANAALTRPEQEPWTDADSDAARLALELECLLLSVDDTIAVSRWWESANKALQLHRDRLQADEAARKSEVTT